jgi:hypothetical protein
MTTDAGNLQNMRGESNRHGAFARDRKECL